MSSTRSSGNVPWPLARKPKHMKKSRVIRNKLHLMKHLPVYARKLSLVLRELCFYKRPTSGLKTGTPSAEQATRTINVTTTNATTLKATLGCVFLNAGVERVINERGALCGLMIVVRYQRESAADQLQAASCRMIVQFASYVRCLHDEGHFHQHRIGR